MNKRIHEGSPIAEVLKDFIEQNNLEKGIESVQIKDTWHEVMGPGVQRYTEKIFLQKNKLMIKLTSAVLREELSFGKTQIINLMNEALKKNLIKDIHLY